MTTALVCGLGLVGRRVARQLVDGGVVDRVVVTARKAKHAQQVAAVLGERAAPMPWPSSAADLGGIDVVATCLAGDKDATMVRAAIGRGIPAASTGDSPDVLRMLAALDADARRAGVCVVAGCGLAPGLSDLLAVHASTLFDSVDEIRVARAGAAGPASVDAVRDQRRDESVIWRSGTWQRCGRLEEQVWFPEPLSAVDCQVVSGGSALIAQRFGTTVTVTTTLAEAKASRWPNRDDDGLGAVRVEVWGQRNGRNDVVVYGVIDRVSIAAGAVLARVTEILGAGTSGLAPGVHGVGALPAADVLRTLSERGVRAAAFEGARIS